MSRNSILTILGIGILSLLALTYMSSQRIESIETLEAPPPRSRPVAATQPPVATDASGVQSEQSLAPLPSNQMAPANGFTVEDLRRAEAVGETPEVKAPGLDAIEAKARHAAISSVLQSLGITLPSATLADGYDLTRIMVGSSPALMLTLSLPTGVEIRSVVAKTPNAKELHDWLLKSAESSGFRATPLQAMTLSNGTRAMMTTFQTVERKGAMVFTSHAQASFQYGFSFEADLSYASNNLDLLARSVAVDVGGAAPF